MSGFKSMSWYNGQIKENQPEVLSAMSEDKSMKSPNYQFQQHQPEILNAMSEDKSMKSPNNQLQQHQPESTNTVKESSENDEPSLEYKYSVYIEGLRKYEDFLRDGYFEIFHKEMEYQLKKNGLVFDNVYGTDSPALKNYEKYKKFLVNEHNKLCIVESGEEAETRKAMMNKCHTMAWPSVVKVLERRQKIVMKRKQAFFEKALSFMEEREEIMLRAQFYKDTDGLRMFLKEKGIARYLTAQNLLEEYQNIH